MAAALGWPEERVATALHDAEQHPDIADPLAVHRSAHGTYGVVVRAGRLSAAQCEVLNRARAT
ncbi:hypothetical protein [Streptomyces aureocirculatus]|uniref:hypothetical protein n=1 Tax=Streptomyces aureocirculatus TaxID=67275 RepID=UPI0006923759|nr:hypothetical protein [Streptomyces aureocirculatus]